MGQARLLEEWKSVLSKKGGGDKKPFFECLHYLEYLYLPCRFTTFTVVSSRWLQLSSIPWARNWRTPEGLPWLLITKSELFLPKVIVQNQLCESSSQLGKLSCHRRYCPPRFWGCKCEVAGSNLPLSLLPCRILSIPNLKCPISCIFSSGHRAVFDSRLWKTWPMRPLDLRSPLWCSLV